MNLKNKLVTTLVSIFALSSVLSFTPIGEINTKADDSLLKGRQVVFSSYKVEDACILSFADYPYLNGKNGEILKISAIDNGASPGTAINVCPQIPKLDGTGVINKTAKTVKSTGKSGDLIALEIPLADWYSTLTHTKSTGVEGTPAGDDVKSLQILMGGSSSVPSRIQDNTINIKIEYADDSSTPDSSKPDDSSTPDTQSGTVYYQTKDNNSAIRFIDEVTIEAAQAAATASEETFVARSDAANNYQSNGKNAITKAYKSIIAGGKTVTAGEGKCYLISSAVSNLSNGDKVKAEFTLGEATNNKEVTISGAADSSKPDESSKPDDSSSTTDPVITQTLWTGEKDLKDWGAELTINGNLHYWGEGTKITVNYEPKTASAETVLAFVSRIGKNWTFTDIGFQEVHIPAGQKSYTFDLSATALASLKQDDCYAMTFKGENATVKSVTITGPNTAPKKPAVENEWVDNKDGTYTFYWTNADGKPENLAHYKIPITGFDYESITKISIDMEATGTINGQFGVAQGASTNYKWKSTNWTFSGIGTKTFDLEVEGVSTGNSIEIEVWWANKNALVNLNSITITGKAL